MDIDRRGWRLFQDLNNAFKRDPNIDEFDFIPVLEPRNNKSPIVLVEHKLGLELWCVKILFQYSYRSLMAWRNKKASKFLAPQELSLLTRSVVLINPECYTVWNIRKEMIESGDISITDDLKLNSIVLTKHPKSSETFMHRRWVLSRFIENHLQSSQGSTCSTGSGIDGFVSIEGIDLNVDLAAQNQLHAQNGEDNGQVGNDYHKQMKLEINVCTSSADKYPCNYYAWSHRTWIIQHCYNCSTQVLLSELQTSQSWVEKHISDMCGYHYREYLLTTLSSQKHQLWIHFSIQYTSLMEKEHHFILDLISTYPGHETMWYHRKFVFSSLYDLHSHISDDDNNERDCESNLKKTRLEIDYMELFKTELDSVEIHGVKSSSIPQQRFSQNYINWLNRTFKVK
ncbi:Protein prenyltransferase alpha subunit repeat-containing protein 1 [Mactra antiquata]